MLAQILQESRILTRFGRNAFVDDVASSIAEE